jgi:hypothetical protein
MKHARAVLPRRHLLVATIATEKPKFSWNYLAESAPQYPLDAAFSGSDRIFHVWRRKMYTLLGLIVTVTIAAFLAGGFLMLVMILEPGNRKR